MQGIEIPDEPNEKVDRTCFASMSKAELELVVIEAIRRHRCLMEADQVVYEEWERSSEDPGFPLEQLQKLEAECLRRQKVTTAQQDALSELLDILGYIPEVRDFS